MPNVSSIFPLILCFARAVTAVLDSANESCSPENHRTQLHFHSDLIYIVTADCRLHVFRSWDAGMPLDVVKPETKLGISPCGPDSKMIHFIHRRHQMPPILVVIVKHSTQKYSLLEIDLKEKLGERQNASVALKDQIGVNTTKQIEFSRPLSSCTFVDAQLLCFWVDGDRKRVFQQKFHFNESDCTYSQRHTDRVRQNQEAKVGQKHHRQCLGSSLNTLRVPLRSLITGWLYRISDQAFLARGQKRKHLHRIHAAEGELKSLASMGKTVLLSTVCKANKGCKYFMNFLQIKASVSHACVFYSIKPVIVGLLIDVRRNYVALQPERLVDMEEEINRFEALIVLASAVFASLAGFLGSAVVHESRTNEQKMETEKWMKALWRRFSKKSDEENAVGNV
ncbi:hypothetical protein L596_012147 [Steinernema carpocapsae]|uniref:Uncharacterized protein n=1 Tax=Steinernema carpocapsae TaxID=34508 RepID=A0A4U5NX28_STECR|nr:hypothetical protein L596_012147 [Steinernema carpocapsae]